MAESKASISFWPLSWVLMQMVRPLRQWSRSPLNPVSNPSQEVRSWGGGGGSGVRNTHAHTRTCTHMHTRMHAHHLRLPHCLLHPAIPSCMYSEHLWAALYQQSGCSEALCPEGTEDGGVGLHAKLPSDKGFPPETFVLSTLKSILSQAQQWGDIGGMLEPNTLRAENRSPESWPQV